MIPRPRGRGPIEAKKRERPVMAHHRFRDRAVAAPLKLGMRA